MQAHPLDRTSDDRCLFAVCGWIQDLPRYEALGERLGGMTVRIIPPGPVMGTLSRASMHTWVNLAADRIEAGQATGDLLIVGYSFGARLAYATATELRRRGRTIRFMGVIEHYGEFPSLWPTRWWCLWGLVRQDHRRTQIEAIVREGIWPRIRVWLSLALAFLHRPPLRVLFGRRRLPKMAGLFGRDDRAAYRTVGIINQWFAPVPADFPVDLFICDEMREQLRDDRAWWGPIARAGFEWHRIEGEHLTLWEDEHIDAFTNVMRHAIERRIA